ncbi:hypothetical protein OROGR_027365 [Orobanche gracilis]
MTQGCGSYRQSKEDRLLRSASCLDDAQLISAVLRASSCVVGIVSLGVPAEMTRFGNSPRFLSKNQAFMGSGTIIECVEEVGNDGIKFSTTILTSSNLFTRSNGVQPSDIQVEVYLANGDLYNGDVLACDFHYNLAVVNIHSDTPLQTANLRDLDDDIISSIHVMSDHQSQSTVDSLSFQLRRHSSSFKIRPGDMVAALARSYSSDICVTSGRFRVDYPELDCKELYSFVSSEHQATTMHDYKKGRLLVEVTHCGLPNRGGPVINCHGEVIGIQAVDNYFLPSNIVSRWWNYYKQCKKFCRPWLGLKVVNLQAADWHFLEAFVREFPTASSGVIVTKVVKNSASYRSGIRSEDVIVQCSGATVRSTLDLFDQIWNKIGASVELSLLRLVSGDTVNLTVTVDEPTLDNFYTWPTPDSVSRPVFYSDSEMSESSDSECRF